MSLRAKGVEPLSSQQGVLRGWRLTFNVHHWFRHEGGVGNITQTGDPVDRVLGLVHVCRDEHLELLDSVESYGVGYDRKEVVLETESGSTLAVTYIGLPSYIDEQCLPTQRYLNIITRGATLAGLDSKYVEALRRHPVCPPWDYPPFRHPEDPGPVFSAETLASQPHLTAVGGAVFDMTNARPKLDCVRELFGGKDMSLFHLKRLDSSDGTETLEDLRLGRVSVEGRTYLNAYLHEFAAEFKYVGRFDYIL